MALSYWEWLNRGIDLSCCLALCLCPVLKVSARFLQYLAQNNVLIKRDSRLREIYEVRMLAARMRKLFTARARKNKRTAHMLANARKDHSIALVFLFSFFRIVLLLWVLFLFYCHFSIVFSLFLHRSSLSLLNIQMVIVNIIARLLFLFLRCIL